MHNLPASVGQYTPGVNAPSYVRRIVYTDWCATWLIKMQDRTVTDEGKKFVYMLVCVCVCVCVRVSSLTLPVGVRKIVVTDI